MEIEWMAGLAGRMRENGIRSMACTMGDASLRIVLPDEPARPAAAAPAQPAAGAARPGAPAGHAVKAGAFGIFHATHPLQPDWGAVPGRRVGPGDVVGFLEVCGVMTAVPCDAEGVVAAVRAPSGQWVQYGEPLLQLSPA